MEKRRTKAIKKNDESMSSVKIMLREMSLIQKDKYPMFSLVCRIWEVEGTWKWKGDYVGRGRNQGKGDG
jgi:hypothetical protein